METNRGQVMTTKAKAAMVLGTILAAGAKAPQADRAATGRSDPGPTNTQLRQSSGGDSKAIPATQAAANAPAISLGSGFMATGPGFQRGSGLSPKDWGMSRACAQMVRKNRLRAAGVASQRI